MAVVTKGPVIKPDMPPGYEDVHRVQTVAVDVEAGDLLVLTADGWAMSTAANPTHQRGLAAQDYAAGRNDCSILIKGEMSGFTGMTSGVPLYPAAAGDLETVEVLGFTGRIYAATATSIRFSL